MRWLVLVALPLFAGCLEDTALGHQELDCSDDSQMVMGASRQVLYPASAPEEIRVAESRASATVTAREGQTLIAQVTYSALSGDVSVLLDADHENQATTDNTWTSQGKVSAGDYTLELAGDPMAFEVRYTMLLMAFGCTPA